MQLLFFKPNSSNCMLLETSKTISMKYSVTEFLTVQTDLLH